MTLRLLLGLCFGLLASVAAAQPPKSPTPTELDKIAVEVLKDVHNRGAEFYNTGDPAACFRMYESALITVKPFLAHRPAVQQVIAAGLEEVSKNTEGVKVQAFRLHEVIEKVRSELKVELKKTEGEPKPKEPVAKPQEPAPMPKEPVAKPKEPTPKPKEPQMKPKDPPSSPKTPEAKPKDPPAPKEPAPAAKGGGTVGRVTLDGKPLAGADVMFVSLKLAVPRVFVATTAADGTYKLAGPMPAGEYAVKVAGASAPAKYQEFGQSGIRFDAKDGANNFDLDLKSK